MEREHHQSSSCPWKNELSHHKKRLTQDQINILESSFNFNKKLDPDQKSQLAQELGIPPRKISVWYQNKRARWKTESLEFDYKELNQRLENLQTDNQRLQSEVERLQQELHKAQEMLLSMNNNNSCNGGGPYSSLSSQLSSSCDEVGSSSLVYDHHGSKNHMDKVDLFACLIGGGQGQFGTTRSDDHDFFPTSMS